MPPKLRLKKLDALNKPYAIFSEYVEQEAIEQFFRAMEHPAIVQGALMPDVHAGYSLPIGAVVAVRGMVFPSFVGYDIGCGVATVNTMFDADVVRAHADDIFKAIYEVVPTGFSRRTESYSKDRMALVFHERVPATDVAKNLYAIDGAKQVGTLGGGNHFIEIGVDEQDIVWVTVHSGSRNLGHSVAKHYMTLASGGERAKEGVFGFDVNTKEGKDYITDLKFCEKFALLNRQTILSEVIEAIHQIVPANNFGYSPDSGYINRNHNHAELKDGLWIHRKGATHAEFGMSGVIPGNMRDGCFIVTGQGYEPALCSSSHGAGRVMSRAKAKDAVKLEDFESTMAGIKAKIGTSTLDESPFAYKDIHAVMAAQSDMLTVKHHIKPLINIKG